MDLLVTLRWVRFHIVDIACAPFRFIAGIVGHPLKTLRYLVNHLLCIPGIGRLEMDVRKEQDWKDGRNFYFQNLDDGFYIRYRKVSLSFWNWSALQTYRTEMKIWSEQGIVQAKDVPARNAA